MFSRAEIAERLGGFVYGTIVVLSVIVAVLAIAAAVVGVRGSRRVETV